VIHSEPLTTHAVLVALKCDDCGVLGPSGACGIGVDEGDRDLMAVRAALEAGWVEQPRRPRRGPPYLAALCPRCAGRTGQMRLGLAGGTT
jgi:hypothetical protein